MTRRLYLHVGMPKCATTTVQDWLIAARPALAEAGLRYDFHATHRPGHQGNGAWLAMEIFAGNRDRVAEMLDFFLSGEGDVILSSENFAGLHNATYMGEVLDHIRARGLEPRIICYLRRQDEWIESDFKQHVKGDDAWTGTLIELRNRRLRSRSLNFALTMAYWARFLGDDAEVRGVVLRPGQPRGFAVAQFAALLDRPELAVRVPAPPSSNISPPTGLIEPARHLKVAMLAAGLDPAIVLAELARFFARAPQVLDVPARRFLLPHAARARLAGRFAGANHDLAQRFLGGHGFDPEPEWHEPSEAPLNDEAARVLGDWAVADRRALRWRARAAREAAGLLRRAGLRK